MQALVAHLGERVQALIAHLGERVQALVAHLGEAGTEGGSATSRELEEVPMVLMLVLLIPCLHFLAQGKLGS